MAAGHARRTCVEVVKMGAVTSGSGQGLLLSKTACESAECVNTALGLSGEGDVPSPTAIGDSSESIYSFGSGSNRFSGDEYFLHRAGI